MTRVLVDANTGRKIEGGDQFDEGTRLQVVFINKNPFKYRYSINHDRVIGRVQSADASGNAISTFGYLKNGMFKPSGVVVLNATLAQPWTLKGAPVSFGLSTGLVVSTRTDDAELEYLGGIALGFLNDTVFVNIGVHAVRVPELIGFKIGDKVPTGLNDPLPLKKDFAPGLMLAVTYRLR